MARGKKIDVGFELCVLRIVFSDFVNGDRVSAPQGQALSARYKVGRKPRHINILYIFSALSRVCQGDLWHDVGYALTTDVCAAPPDGNFGHVAAGI